MADVRGRRLDAKIATTLGYLASVMLKALEVSDLEERLAKLEERYAVSAKDEEALCR
jgi:hypothetical protein